MTDEKPKESIPEKIYSISQRLDVEGYSSGLMDRFQNQVNDCKESEDLIKNEFDKYKESGGTSSTPDSLSDSPST